MEALAHAPKLHLAVHARVRKRLQARPVEDLRVDFEGSYGTRDDAEEDAKTRREAPLGRHAATVADKSLPGSKPARASTDRSGVLLRSR